MPSLPRTWLSLCRCLVLQSVWHRPLRQSDRMPSSKFTNAEVQLQSVAWQAAAIKLCKCLMVCRSERPEQLHFLIATAALQALSTEMCHPPGRDKGTSQRNIDDAHLQVVFVDGHGQVVFVHLSIECKGPGVSDQALDLCPAEVLCHLCNTQSRKHMLKAAVEARVFIG